MFLQQRQRLTHELLTTFLAEVTSISNAWHLLRVSTDPNETCILTRATLQTKKKQVDISRTSMNLGADILKNRWKSVQHLTETFWGEWRKAYIPYLQTPTKWTSKEYYLKQGDIVLLKDNQTERNSWHFGLVIRVFSSADVLERKVEVKVSRKGGTKYLFRLITETVLPIPWHWSHMNSCRYRLFLIRIWVTHCTSGGECRDTRSILGLPVCLPLPIPFFSRGQLLTLHHWYQCFPPLYLLRLSWMTSVTDRSYFPWSRTFTFLPSLTVNKPVDK